jgi:hypothetical protein
MWYLGAFFAMFVQLAAASLIGQGLLQYCLRRRMRPVATLFLSPLAGLSVLVLAATAAGWLGHGYRQWLCVGLTAGFCLAGAWLSREGRGFSRRIVFLAGFALLSSFPMLQTLLAFNCYSPFNDAFIYLTHAQWLQSHGFRDAVTERTLHPALSQVTLFQQHGLRMGTSFLLGWLQAFYGLRWASDIYPTASALAVTCGGLAVGAIVLTVCPRQRAEAWLAALAATVTLNGFAFGSIFGFLPQTYGSAFAAGALALRGLEVASDLGLEPSRNPIRSTLPLALCMAAAIVSYSEQMPFLVCTIGLSYLLPWQSFRAAVPETWRRHRARLIALACWLALLVNVEWYRSIKGILLQMSVPGAPVYWNWWDFPAHALGLKSGIVDGEAWFFTIPGIRWLLMGVLVGSLLVAPVWWSKIRRPLRAARWSTLGPVAILMGLFTLAFVYFRYAVPSPLPDAPGNPVHLVGRTFSQFKLSNWSSLVAMTLALSGLAVLGGVGGRLGRAIVLGLLLFWCALGLTGNHLHAAGRVAPILQITNESTDPFEVYKGLHRSLSGIGPDALVYLDMPLAATIVHRQFLAYFLEDHPVAADWKDDGYIISWLRLDRPMPAIGDCDWVVSWSPPLPGPGLYNPGGLTIKPSSRHVFALLEKDGPYPREFAGTDWWYWTDRDLRLKYQATGPHPRQVRLHFVYRPATPNRVLLVSIIGATPEPPINIQMDRPGESSYVTPPIEVPDGEHANLELDFSCSSPGVRASATDARSISYSVGDVDVEPLK